MYPPIQLTNYKCISVELAQVEHAKCWDVLLKRETVTRSGEARIIDLYGGVSLFINFTLFS